MRKVKNPVTLMLAMIVGASTFLLANSLLAAVDPLDLVSICFRGRTIQVPTYLKDRYLAVPGSLNGPCPSSPP